jgi:hypothetical protein
MPIAFYLSFNLVQFGFLFMVGIDGIAEVVSFCFHFGDDALCK